MPRQRGTLSWSEGEAHNLVVAWFESRPLYGEEVPSR